MIKYLDNGCHIWIENDMGMVLIQATHSLYAMPEISSRENVHTSNSGLGVGKEITISVFNELFLQTSQRLEKLVPEFFEYYNAQRNPESSLLLNRYPIKFQYVSSPEAVCEGPPNPLPFLCDTRSPNEINQEFQQGEFTVKFPEMRSLSQSEVDEIDIYLSNKELPEGAQEAIERDLSNEVNESTGSADDLPF